MVLKKDLMNFIIICFIFIEKTSDGGGRISITQTFVTFPCHNIQSFCWCLYFSTLALLYNRPTLCSSASWDQNAVLLLDNYPTDEHILNIFVDSGNTIYVTSLSKEGYLMRHHVNVDITKTPPDWNISPESRVLCITVMSVIRPDNTIESYCLKNRLLDANNQIDNQPSNTVDFVCAGLFFYIDDTLYCSMTNTHKVVKNERNDSQTIFTTIAGVGIVGSSSTMLNSPIGIFVNTNFDLYVADCHNHRIQRFHAGERDGETVAGNGSLNITIDLLNPTSIVLDADYYLFILDQGQHRIVGSGPTGFRCLVGCSNPPSSAFNQLDHPQSLSFDSFGNMLLFNYDNYRIQKFSLSTNGCNVPLNFHPFIKAINFSNFNPYGKTLATSNSTTNAPPSSEKQDAFATPPATKLTSIVSSASIEVSSTTSTSAKIMIATRVARAQATQIRTVLITKTALATNVKSDTPPSAIFLPKPCNDSTHMGPLCNIPNTACEMLKPCLNNGSCENDDTKPFGYVCTCSPDFHGTQCQSDHRPCEPNPCWHNGTCNATANATYTCDCSVGWHGHHCETMDNYCEGIQCQNRGVCRPSFRNYTCECLGTDFSGQFCEITAPKITIFRIVSKSFAYVGIIAMVSVAMFIVIMDILKYCFGIDPVHEERELIRRQRQAKRRKPVIQRFTYVNAPAPSPPSAQPNCPTEETVA